MTETAPPQDPPTTWWPQLAKVGIVVDKRIRRLQAGVQANRATGVAALARLRRGVGKPPGAVQDILEHTLAPEFADPDAGDEPTNKEWAAHISMTLYALHQQSHRQPMHQRGFGLGRSIRQLNGRDVDGAPGPVRRRFDALATADSLDELVYHARGMVQLLRAKAIPLDYALLADQLVRWQKDPNGPQAVRRVWGRDFYYIRTQSEQPDNSVPEGD